MSQLSNTQNPDNCRCINHYHDRKPKLKLETQTTNKAFYKPLPIERPPQYEMPKVQQKHYDPEVLQSSYKSQYKKIDASQSSDNFGQSSKISTAQDYLARKPKVPFYGETSYKQTFKPKPIVVEKQPAYEYKPKDTKFEGQSSYKTDFLPKKNTELMNAGSTIATVQSYMDRKPKIPFEGSSAYKDTFKQHEIKIQKQPEYKYSKNPNKFEGQSSYKQTFKQPPKEVYSSGLQYCPVHPGKIAMK